MITLHTFGPAFGLPDPSPFVMKAEILLKMAGVPYRTVIGSLRRAPKGKLPYIEDDGTVVPDSTFIRFHLETKHGIDFDSGLATRAERGAAWAFEKLCEDYLYWGAILRDRWLDDVNFRAGPLQFFSGVPAFVRPAATTFIRQRARARLHAQGLGRHAPAEIDRLMARAIDAIADGIGDGPYLMGTHPCGADATVAAFVAGILCPLFRSATRDAAMRHPNVVSYADRMMREYYPARTDVSP